MTTYIKQWIPEFDSKWADKKAPVYGTDAKRVKEFWAWESRLGVERGSLLHNYLEALFQRKVIVPSIPDYIDSKVMDKLFEMARNYFKSVEEPIVALEIVMGNNIVGGTADKLLQGSKGLILRDYKTGQMKSAYGNLLKEYSHMEASTLDKYSLQLNGYRDLLESNGFPVEKMEIIWFNENNDEHKIFEIPRFEFIWQQ